MKIDQQTMLPINTMLHDTYRVDRYLSSGGFGNTYVVTNVHFDERLALKEFFIKGISQRKGQTTVKVDNADNRDLFDSQLEKFKKEAYRLRRLKNENIVHVHDFFEENGTAYYVMDLIDGESLSAKMKRLCRPLKEAEVTELLPQVLNALEGMHNQHIWHLDLKPGNIMQDRQGHVILIDFGASKQMDALQSCADTSSAMCFTPGFAPTEQIDGSLKRIGPWTDFYALGATIYNLLTSQQPPSSSDVTSDGAEAFTFPTSVSNGMRQLIIWLMEARPANRPQSVADINEWNSLVKSIDAVQWDEDWEKKLNSMMHEIEGLILKFHFKEARARLKQIRKIELNPLYDNKVKGLYALLFRKEDEVEKKKQPSKILTNDDFDF